MASANDAARSLRPSVARWLWGAPGSGLGPPWLRLPRLTLLTAEAFARNRLSMHASGLTFYLLLSVVPFLAFVLLVLRMFYVADFLRPHLLGFVVGGNPALVPRIDEYIRNAQNVAVGGIGGLGVASLFAVGILLLLRVKGSLNAIWGARDRRRYGTRLVEYVAVLVATPALLAAAFGVSGFLGSPVVLQYVPGLVLRLLPSLPVAHLTGYGILVLLTFYAYCSLPDARVQAGPALLGALVAGAGLVLVQQFYVVLMVVVARQSLIYGALALLPFLMLWFYLAWLVFLAGAQLSYVAQHYAHELERRRGGESTLGHQPYRVLLVLATLLRRLAATGRGVHRRELARALRLPADTLDETLSALTAAGLVTPVQGDAARYVPQEVLERLTVGDVLRRAGLMPGFADVPLWPGPPAGNTVLSLFRETNNTLAALLAGTTLGELAERMGRMEGAPQARAAAERESADDTPEPPPGDRVAT